MKGLTLIEVLASLVILSFVMIGVARLADTYTNSIRTTAVAQQTTAFGQALQKYVSDNNSAIAAIATSTTPVLIRVSTLTAANYLTGGYTPINGYGQSICGLVLQPTAGQLNAIVITEGGTAINDFDLGDIAAAVGAAGGGLYTAAPTTLKGTMGGWSFAAGNFGNTNNLGFHCDGSAGAVAFTAGHPVMSLWFTGFDTTSGLLYRNAVPGQPQLNQMNTPIVMSVLKTAGTACTAPGAIAQNSTQTSLVVCGSNNVWNTVGNSIAGITNGGLCSTSGQLGSDANNVAYTCNGSYWSPVSTLMVNYSSGSPTGCTINNQIANSITTQELLVCRNSFWVKLANLIPSNAQLQTGQVTVSANNFVAAPICDWGGRTWYSFETINTGVEVSLVPPREVMKLSASPTMVPGAGWNISITLVDTSAGVSDAAYLNFQEIFHYGCSY